MISSAMKLYLHSNWLIQFNVLSQSGSHTHYRVPYITRTYALYAMFAHNAYPPISILSPSGYSQIYEDHV